MNIKRLIPVGLVAAAGLTIAACGGSSSSSAPASNSNPPVTAPSPTQQYLSAVENAANAAGENGLAALVESSPATVSQLGESFCSDMTNGSDVGTEVTEGENGLIEGDPSLDVTDAGTDVGIVIGAAANTLCPQFQSQVQQFAQANS